MGKDKKENSSNKIIGIEEINNFKRKKTIIIIAHRISTITKCDYIYEFDNGTIKSLSLIHI